MAPVLCDIFLSKCDRAIDNALTKGQVSRIFRYVDDYLVFLTKRPIENEAQIIHTIKSTFLNEGQGLNFTHETPTNLSLQFLDLHLMFKDRHTCWKYSPRTKKRPASVRLSSLKNHQERNYQKHNECSLKKVVHTFRG